MEPDSERSLDSARSTFPTFPASPPTAPGHVPETPDATGGLIPYKNPKALIAYYLGVFSLASVLVPLLGLAISIPAIVLGIKGLQFRKAHPTAGGTAHAWVGIALGGIMSVIQLAVATLIAIAIANK